MAARVESQEAEGGMTDVIETRTGQTWLRHDGILQAESHPDSEHRLQDAIENLAASARLARGVQRPTLICLRQIKSMNREARQYYSGPESAKLYVAAALLIGAGYPAQRIAIGLMAGLAIALGINAWSQKMIGGQTGDVAGGITLLAEMAGLIVLSID